MRGEQSTKAVRRQLVAGPRAIALMTVVVIAGRLPERPLGIGIVSGLVLYQLVFVVNVMRVVTSQGGMGDDAVTRETIHVGDHPHFSLFA